MLWGSSATQLHREAPAVGLNGRSVCCSEGCLRSGSRNVPAVDFPDICVYLIHPPSTEALNAYKSTDAWAYLSAGYVSDIKLMQLNSETCLVVAKVSYLILASSIAFNVAIFITLSGSAWSEKKLSSSEAKDCVRYNDCAHCNCMAGTEKPVLILQHCCML